jgi:NitT/TauT family transport system ATP-binding protein
MTINDLSFSFGKKNIFQSFNLELENDDPVVILGPSGCGKTTVLRLIAGLLTPDRGKVQIGGTAEIIEKARRVSFVFQEPRLLPWKTVLANVTLPIEELLGKNEAKARAQHFLRLVSLDEKENAMPHELSGGQKQRVSMARAFAYPSELLLMDEPFQSLDIPLRKQLMDLTLLLIKESPRRLIAVTHDPREAVYLGKRVIVLGNTPCKIIFDEEVNLETEGHIMQVLNSIVMDN